jgi:ElaB/YqjD/DUF883 family membrane-anchored ribosome-binding protein
LIRDFPGGAANERKSVERVALTRLLDSSLPAAELIHTKKEEPMSVDKEAMEAAAAKAKALAKRKADATTYKPILIAAGVGVIIGLLLKR